MELFCVPFCTKTIRNLFFNFFLWCWLDINRSKAARAQCSCWLLMNKSRINDTNRMKQLRHWTCIDYDTDIKILYRQFPDLCSARFFIQSLTLHVWFSANIFIHIYGNSSSNILLLQNRSCNFNFKLFNQVRGGKGNRNKR